MIRFGKGVTLSPQVRLAAALCVLTPLSVIWGYWAASASRDQQPLAQVRRSQGDFQLTAGPLRRTLSIEGEIPNLPELAEELRTELKKHSVKTVILNSVGGEVITGLRLGEAIRQAGVDVEVPLICLSSCANYLFPAGRHKLVRPGAIVGFHGDPLNIPNLTLDTAQGRAYFQQYRAEAAPFFARVGLDRRMLAYSVKQTTGQNISLWVPTRAELTCAGVQNVEMSDWDGVFSSLRLSSIAEDTGAFGVSAHNPRLPDYCTWRAAQGR